MCGGFSGLRALAELSDPELMELDDLCHRFIRERSPELSAWVAASVFGERMRRNAVIKAADGTIKRSYPTELKIDLMSLDDESFCDALDVRIRLNTFHTDRTYRPVDGGDLPHVSGGGQSQVAAWPVPRNTIVTTSKTEAAKRQKSLIESPMISVTEAFAMMNISESIFRRWMFERKNELPPIYRLGKRCIRLFKADVESWIRNRRV